MKLDKMNVFSKTDAEKGLMMIIYKLIRGMQ